MDDDIQRLLKQFQRLSVELARHQRSMADAVRMGPTDLLALGLLASRGPMAVNELGRALELSSGSVTELVQRLEAVGHAARVRDEADRRRVVVAATAQAGQAARTALAPFLTDLRRELAACTPEERAGAERVLGAALDALVRRMDT